MTDPRWRARVFGLTAALAVAGAVTVLVGSRMVWERGTIPGSVVSTDEGSVRFPDQVEIFDADDLGSPTTAVGIVLLVTTIMPLLVGPRIRPILYVIAAAVSLGAIATSQMAAQLDYPGVTTPGPGRIVTVIGGGTALAASMIAIGPSSGVPRLGIPERAHDERA